MAATVTFRIGLGLLFAQAASLAWGEAAVSDPTRPPTAAVAPAAGGTPTAAGTPGEGELVLQSVFLPRNGRAMAVISGQRVFLGGKLGEDRVARINETEVLLSGSGGDRHLLLNPAVSVKPVTASPRVGKKHPSRGENQ